MGEGKSKFGIHFPSDTVQVVYALLDGGFTPDQLGRYSLEAVARHLELSLQSGDGLIGFGKVTQL